MSEEVLETAETVEAVEAPVSEADTSKYTVEDLQKQIKPLSKNGFVRFFQKIGRWWLGTWYGFADKHPKLSDLIYKVFFLVVFSQGVTIYQMIALNVLEYAFGTGLASIDFMWPKLQITMGDGFSYYWNIIGYDIVYDKAGNVDIGGGLGAFISWMIAIFTAQCINFPLQRNITYRSHGNPWWQAMWYFIGFVLVTLFCNMINGLWLPIGARYMPTIIYNILGMISQGGIAICIFFFIFMIIFPDNNKMAKKSKAKYEKLVAKNAPTEKIVKAENVMKLWEDKATKSNSEKEYFKAKSQVNASVMRYNAIVKASQNPKIKEEEKAAYPEKIQKAFDTAVEAINVRDEKEAAFEASKAI